MLYLANIKGGKNIEQVLRLTLGPLERWAYSTTHEDVRLRSRIADAVGLNKSLQILAEEFPGGDAKNYITAKSAGLNSLNNDKNVLDIIKDELLFKYKNTILAD
jgi:intracellular multiplication protein IcmB